MTELEAEIWCPQCHSFYAKVLKYEIAKDVWGHRTEPESVPQICNRCQVVLERHP